MNETNLSTKDQNWFESRFQALAKLFSPKNIIVQDMDGVEIDFPDVAEGDEVNVGEKATIDGASAEGEYVMTNGDTYVFVSGELTEIKPKVENDPDPKIEELEIENSSLKDEIAKLKDSFNKAKSEFEKFRKDVKETFKYDAKVEHTVAKSKNRVIK